MKNILFICHGNICRSPMAEFVMKGLVKKAGLASQFHIESAATSREEIGNPVYSPARRKLAEKVSNFESRLPSPQSKLAAQTMQQHIDDLDKVGGVLGGGVGLAGGVLGGLLVLAALQDFKPGGILGVDGLHGGGVSAHVGVVLHGGGLVSFLQFVEVLAVHKIGCHGGILPVFSVIHTVVSMFNF